MTNPAYLPQAAAPDWLTIQKNGMWDMVGPAVQQDKANQETAAFNKQLADMFQQQSQQMHPLKMQAESANIDQSKAAADYSRQLAATSADNLAAQPPAPLRQEAAKTKLTADQAKMRYEQAKVAMGELAHWATAFETGGLQAIMEAPEHIRQKMVQPGVAKQVLAQTKLMAQYDPEYVKAIKLQEMKEQGDTSRNNASIAAQNTRAQNKTKPSDPFVNIEKNITTKNGAYEAGIAGKTLVEFMLSQIDTADPENATAVQELKNKLARYTTIAQAAQEQRAKEISDKGDAAAQSGIDKTVGTINAVAPGTIKPNPAAAVPNLTSQVREQTKGLPSEALKQLKPGEITTFGNGQKWTVGKDGKPQKVN